MIEGIICQELETGESVRFIAKTTKNHDALLVEHSLSREAIINYLNKMRQCYNFKIKYISDCSSNHLSKFVIKNICNLS